MVPLGLCVHVCMCRKPYSVYVSFEITMLNSSPTLIILQNSHLDDKAYHLIFSYCLLISTWVIVVISMTSIPLYALVSSILISSLFSHLISPYSISSYASFYEHPVIQPVFSALPNLDLSFLISANGPLPST